MSWSGDKPPLNWFAERVYRRRYGDVGIDPVTIIAIISALIEIGRLVAECYREWKRDEVLAAYNAWGPLGWLSRRRLARAVREKGLDGQFAAAIVAEAASIDESDYRVVVGHARVAGNY